MANQGKKNIYMHTFLSRSIVRQFSIFPEIYVTADRLHRQCATCPRDSKSLISKILLKILSFEARAINTLSIYLFAYFHFN